MTTKNSTTKIVETTILIAKAVAKDSDYSSDTRKAARNFLKRKKDQRPKAAPALVSLVAKEQRLDENADAALVLANATGQPTPRKAPAKAAAPAKKKAAPAEPKTEEPKGDDEPAPTFSEEMGMGAVNKGRPAATIKVKSVADAIAQAEGKHLGDLCGWSLSGPRAKDLVETLAAKHGLTDDLAFPKLTPNACYRKAISQVFTVGSKNERKWMAVVVENSSEKMVHSIVGSTVVDDSDDAVSSKDAAFNTEIKVGFNKQAYRDGASAEGCLVLEDDQHPAAVRLKEVYLELAHTYLTNDIRNAFQAAFKTWDACSVLPHGGLWYIPSVHADKVRHWNQFMIDLGMTTVVIPAFDTKETIASLREATRNGLEGQLQEVLWLLDYYSQQGWAKTRTNTLEARIEDFEELRNRAELYSNILGTTITDLTDKVQQAADRLTNDVAGRHEQDERDAQAAAEAKADAKQKKQAERDAAKKAKQEEKAAAKKAAAKQGKKTATTKAVA